MNFFHVYLPLAGVLLSLVMTVLVIRKNFLSPLHRVFSLFMLSMGAWAITIFLMRINSDLSQALVWEKAFFGVMPFIAISFFHFVLLLTNEKIRNKLLIAAYSLLIVFVGLAPTDLLVAGMKKMWYGNGFIAGPLFIPYVCIFYGIVIFSILQLVRASLASKNSQEKTRYKYVAAGGLICLLGVVFDVIAAKGVRIYPMGILSNILFSLLTAYAMLKYHLLDFHMVMRRSIAYGTTSVLGIALVLATVSIIYTIWGIDTWSGNPWIQALLIIVIALIMQPVLRWTQNRVDKLFDRGRNDYIHTMDNLIQETQTITDLKSVVESTLSTIISSVHCRNASILLPDSEEKCFVTAATQGLIRNEELNLKRAGVLAWWMENHRDFLTRADIETRPQFKALTIEEKGLLEKLKVDLLAPLVTREGIRGILILGRKLSDQDFTPEELRVLRIVTHQIATTMDNARLYDLQKRAYLEQTLLTKLSTIVASNFDIKEIGEAIVKELKGIIPIDYTSINLPGEDPKSRALYTWMNKPETGPGYELTVDLLSSGLDLLPGQDMSYERDLDHRNRSVLELKLGEAEIKSFLMLPLKLNPQNGLWLIASRTANAYQTKDLDLIKEIATHISIAIEKIRLYEAERNTRLELERKDRDRTDLVNALVHEMNTPLTAIVASSELLSKQVPSEMPIISNLARNIDTSTHNLSRRVTELMNFARLQTGDVVLQKELIDLNRLTKQAGEQTDELFRSHGQTFNLEVPGKPIWVEADQDRLSQVLLNLLTNASKFSVEPNKIRLRAYIENKEAVVEVRDSSQPLSPEEISMIFKPYYRRDRGKGSGGLGLGLFICQRMIQLHEGRIWVEGNTDGNSFKFALPLADNLGEG